MTTPDPNSIQQIFYVAQGLFKGPELSVPALPTTHNAPCQPRRGIRLTIGKQATIRLDGNIDTSGGFGSEELPKEAHSHSHSYSDPTPATAGIERPASVPPILEDDTMHGVKVKLEAGARANWKRKWD